MYIVGFFIGTDGTPETGLSATVDGLRLEDNTKVLSAVACTAGNIDGVYYYDFSTADERYHYVFTIDSVTLPGLLRYAPGISPVSGAEIATVATNVSQLITDFANQYYNFRDMRRKFKDWGGFKNESGRD